MIDFYITEQSIRFASPVIAANSLSFLEAQFHFSGETWDGYSKWAHFRQGETVYDINLLNDRIDAEMGLDLSIGAWEVYVTGSRGASRLTTVPVILTVMESGLIDEPLHKMPMTVAEQVDNKASLALEKAMRLETDAENGRFDGRSFAILGFFGSLEELEETIEQAKEGDMYCVGTGEPYDMYIFDAPHERWVNNGPINVKGERGAQGFTYTPSIDVNGNLSWSNNGGMSNPQTVNIMGPKGERGERGSDGRSPFEIAQEEGFLGTEDTFNWCLKNIAAHAAAHGQFGADMISVATAMLENGAVTAEKIANGAVSAEFTAVIRAQGWSGSEPAVNTLEIQGVRECDRPTADLICADDFETAMAESEAYALIYDIRTDENRITLYAREAPETDITIQLRTVRK